MSDVDLTPTSLTPIARAEHRRVNGVGVKAVVGYGFDGVNVAPLISDQVALQVDPITTAGVIYLGTAPIGSVTSAAAWQIQAINVAGGTVGITWANGSNAFNQIYDNRASLTYE